MIKIKKLFIILRKILFYVIDTLFKLKKNILKKNNNNIFIIRLDNIGDFILWIESAKEIIKFYRQKKIIFICSKTIYKLALATNIFDKVIPIDTNKFEKNIFYRIKKIILLKKLNGLLVINPTYSRKFLRCDSIVRQLNVDIKIGNIGDLSNMNKIEKIISNQWYTQLLKNSDKLIHELERNSYFNFKLGVKNNKNIKLANLNFIKINKIKFKEIIKSEYIIICPGGSVSYKRWPVSNFASLVNFLHEIYKIPVIIVGDKKEKYLSKKLYEEIKTTQKFDFTGNTNLEEYIYLIKNAKLLIGNDSSAIHISTAVKTESICILDWEGVPNGRFLPYPEKVIGIKPICIFREFYKTNQRIRVKEVLNQCLTILDQ